MSETFKILFIGEPGAGKTTCIACLSDIPPLTTDVECTDELAERKATTTVALDYGELTLDDNSRLMLYGLPGQARFKFMFDVVREGLLGVIVLVDASSTTAVAGLRETLESYAREIRGRPCVVALNKSASPPLQLLADCEQLLKEFKMVAPILLVDARNRADLATMFELLFILLEHGEGVDERHGAAQCH